MTTSVITFSPEEPVVDAMSRLVEADVDGGPVVDDDGVVVGVLTTGDLIVQESRLHFPTVISVLGGRFELPSAQREFEDDLKKAASATVSDAMEEELVTVGPDDTVETIATRMHDNDISRVPVVDDEGKLVGLVARGDILRAIIDDLDDD
ncbi:MAG: CBS domain-containing protein [Actinomycetota bacterium]